MKDLWFGWNLASVAVGSSVITFCLLYTLAFAWFKVWFRVSDKARDWLKRRRAIGNVKSHSR